MPSPLSIAYSSGVMPSACASVRQGTQQPQVAHRPPRDRDPRLERTRASLPGQDLHCCIAYQRDAGGIGKHLPIVAEGGSLTAKRHREAGAMATGPIENAGGSREDEAQAQDEDAHAPILFLKRRDLPMRRGTLGLRKEKQVARIGRYKQDAGPSQPVSVSDEAGG